MWGKNCCHSCLLGKSTEKVKQDTGKIEQKWSKIGFWLEVSFSLTSQGKFWILSHHEINNTLLRSNISTVWLRLPHWIQTVLDACQVVWLVKVFPVEVGSCELLHPALRTPELKLHTHNTTYWNMAKYYFRKHLHKMIALSDNKKMH